MADIQQEWRTPRPLWKSILTGDGTARATRLVQPAILRFATDSFMEDFLSVLERDPSRLDGFVARPETWRRPAAVPAATKKLLEPRPPMSAAARKRALAQRIARGGADLAVDPPEGDGPGRELLKLYHPAHQRYYLVTGSLVCRMVGVPDRKLNPVRDERASFVVRRLLPALTPQAGSPFPPADAHGWEEYAFVATPDGNQWRKVGPAGERAPATLVPGEEQHRLFGTRFIDDGGFERRVFAGLVPVGSREAYLGAPLGEPATGEPASNGDGTAGTGSPSDPRFTLLSIQVLEPWRNLIDQAAAARDRVDEPNLDDPLDDPPGRARREALGAVREQIQTISWYILLDLADFLANELPDVWADVQAGTPPVPGTLLHALNLPVPIGDQSEFLRTTVYSAGDIEDTLADALKAVTVDGVRTGLERVTKPYQRDDPDPDWPSFLFPLVDPDGGSLAELRTRVRELEQRIEAELATVPTAGPQPALPAMRETAHDARTGWFVIRCVFEQPLCGMVKPPLLSAPTEPFQLAGFFDPDAPARPIRIALPADTTPAGLRKFAKNTVFQFSDILCGQVNALKKLTFGDLVRSVLPWPFHKDLPVGDVGVCKGPGQAPAGMACSLSIPIVTICALILLIMIVSLLDFFFRWIPYFIACFRIPGLSGKSS